jgi:hypothetical protein
VQYQGPLALGGFHLSQDVLSKYQGVSEPEKDGRVLLKQIMHYTSVFLQP